MEKQLKPKKERTFFDWLFIRGIMNKNVGILFMVPPHIVSLPCGCKRDRDNDLAFRVKKDRNGNLVHSRGYDHSGCFQESCVLLEPEEDQIINVSSFFHHSFDEHHYTRVMM